MKKFEYKLNKISIELQLHYYAGNLSISSDIGVLISGFIKEDKFYLQFSDKTIHFFQNDLIHTMIKIYNKEYNCKIYI